MGFSIYRRFKLLDRATRNKVVGLFFIFLVSVIWAAASFLVKDLEEDEKVHPLILTYIANALFLVYLPIAKLRNWCCPPKKERPARPPVQTVSEEGEGEEEDGEALVGRSEREGENGSDTEFNEDSVIYAAALIAPLWWLAQFTFNLSLTYTSVTSNTVLSTTSTLFTFLLSIWVIKEPFAMHKLVSLLLCMLGSILIALSDQEGGKTARDANPGLGDFLSLVSAMIYATYTVTLKKVLPEDDKTDMALFLGYMGLIQSVVVGLLVWLLHGFGVVSAIISQDALGKVVLKGIFDNVLSDYLWARAVLLIGPTIASVGLSMQLPVAAVGDVLFSHPAWLYNVASAIPYILGVVLLLVGFYDINMERSIFRHCFKGGQTSN